MPTARPDRTPARRAELVKALMEAAAYPHEVERPVRLVETHISHLFLTGEYVYKIKKPVDLGFLDFTTLERRRRFTSDELELNRATSPDVYLGISEVRRGADGRLRMDGDGEVEEYALKMRQLAADDVLVRLVLDGRAGTRQMALLGRYLARFHGRASPAATDSEHGGPDVVRKLVFDNLAAVGPWAAPLSFSDQVGRVAAYTQGAVQALRPLIAARKAAGWVRDCHGDLHADNIFLERRSARGPGRAGRLVIQIIDRIEFSDRYRFIDVASDLAFLTMDLKRLRRPDLADALVLAYLDDREDPELRTMMRFYEVYRAMVRCKVAVLRRPPEAATAREYAGLAARLVAAQRPQAMFVMTGVAGSGKSTVAQELAGRWGIRHVSSDVVRKTLFGLDPHRPSDPSVRDQLYSPRMSGATYRELVRQGEEELAAGRSVVLDASFLKRDHRKRARMAALRRGIPFLVIECRLDSKEARARLRRRYASGKSESDAGPELLAYHLSERQAVSPQECYGHVVVDTSGDPGLYMDEAEAEMWRQLLRP
ncbi:MAG: AAA family ATPase [Chloroflexi bacterium]|nr:AAA family ATPase [Chloroflexota bacterium]